MLDKLKNTLDRVQLLLEEFKTGRSESHKRLAESMASGPNGESVTDLYNAMQEPLMEVIASMEQALKSHKTTYGIVVKLGMSEGAKFGKRLQEELESMAIMLEEEIKETKFESGEL